MPPPPARDIILRLPRTFQPAMNGQLAQWELLFPAEQRSFRSQLDWLARLPARQFQDLFAPILSIENKMDLPGWNPNAAGLTVQNTGILARSPLYPRWRAEVERVFAAIDDAVESSASISPSPRLVVCTLPPGLPLAAQPLWPELTPAGTWLRLSQPFRAIEDQFALALATRPGLDTVEDIESDWIWECDAHLSTLLASTRAVVPSWSATAAVRRAFLDRLNTIRRDLRSVDQTHEDLKRLDIAPLLGSKLGATPRLREFLRSVLLSGNGSLVFNNSFVQWGSSETLRRVQPRVLIARFGIRPKLKPFSSAVLFEDQAKNEQREEDDPAGSLIDSLLLARYVHLAALRQRAYQGNTLTLLAASDLDRILMLGAPPPPLAALTAADLANLALGWLQRNTGR